MYAQIELLEKMRPVLQQEGVIFQKKKNVYARPALVGEAVQTVTKDGIETENLAEEGDYVVRNQTDAGEAYLVPANKFSSKYAPLRMLDDGWAEYTAVGRIVAVELTQQRLEALDLPAEFEFVAAWGAAMVAKAGDFLGGPEDFSEVYRLARKEFFETYAPAADTTGDQE
ncbi:MAG: hypothetical protein ACKVU2_09500 [Saprospiraceae bacterium]